MANLWLSLLFISFLRLVSAGEYTFAFRSNKKDFHYKVYQGDTLNVWWDGWPNGRIAETIGSEYADLYVASWNFTDYEYSQKLTADVDVSLSGTYSWEIDIKSDALSSMRRYGLFFVKEGDEYQGKQPESLHTKGFIILDIPTESSSSAMPSSTSTPAATGSTEPTSPPTSTPTTATSDTSSEKEPLSRKESAGIGAGVGIACSAIAFGLAYWFLRRRRKKSAPESVETAESSAAYHPASNHPEAFEVPSDSHTNHSDIPPYYQAPKTEPQEMPAESVSLPPAELSSEPHLR